MSHTALKNHLVYQYAGAKDGGNECIMSWPAQVLIIAQESGERDKLQKVFNDAGVHAFCYSTLMEAQSFLSGQPVSAIFVEAPLPDGDFRAFRENIEHYQKHLPIVAMIRNMDWNSYLSSMGAGAFDCLELPPRAMEAKRVLWSALQECSTAARQEIVAA
jgi:DNA-binding NtrC family response regulator